MKYWLDTEFMNRGAGHPIDLISIGIVAEDNRELYEISVEAPIGHMARDGWLRANVWPTLPLLPINERGILDWDHDHPDILHVRRVEDIRKDVYDFLMVDGEPEIWGSYSGFDYVILSQLWGTFDDTPTGMPMFIYDLQQVMVPQMEVITKNAKDAGRGARPVQTGARHHALEDAKHLRKTFEWVFPW